MKTDNPDEKNIISKPSRKEAHTMPVCSIRFICALGVIGKGNPRSDIPENCAEYFSVKSGEYKQR